MLAFAAVWPRLVPPKTLTVAEAPEWEGGCLRAYVRVCICVRASA